MNLSGNIINGSYVEHGSQIYNNGSIGVLNLTYINNQTIIINGSYQYLLYANLTDDMGNKITGQNISFYVNGILVGIVESIEDQQILLILIKIMNH